MITLEMINFLATGLGSAWLTMSAQKSADIAEERKYNSAHYDKVVAAAEAARGADAKWRGFYWIRGAMALICATYFFIFPMLAMFFANVQIVIGYIDIFGIPFFGLDQDMVLWIKFGSGAVDAKVLVYDPVKNNIMLSIIAMYFGNQIARRA